jgi:Baseplate J-like protein
VTFVDRKYPDLVRDVLTNLTQGVAGELHRVSYDPNAHPIQIPDVVLSRRPVKRVSVVEGLVAGAAPDDPPVPYTFGLNDYELVPDANDTDSLSTIRFLPFGRKPAPDTDLRVNYYPRTTAPAPITDLSVGSVVRTLLETFAKEQAILYAQLNLAYDSAFVETATGSSLDRVVALLGYQRFRAGRPVGTVTFSRRAGAVGEITIPAGTPVTDAADKVRYETAESRLMRAGETAAEIAVRGSTDNTPPVDANALTVIQRAIAGLDAVTNERPTARATSDESDAELRARTRDALISSNKGTLGALRNGLLQLPEVRDVKIIEMPNGVPGEVMLNVSLAQNVTTQGDELPDAVKACIEDLRPAGIRIVGGKAGTVDLAAKVQLTLAGSQLAKAEVSKVQDQVRKTLVGEVARRGVGDRVRIKPMVAAVLKDERIVDADILLAIKGSAPAGTDLDPPAGAAVQLDAANISFNPETFDQPLPAGQTVPLDISAKVGALLQGTVTATQAQSLLTAKLKSAFGSVAADTSVDINFLLNALRDDANYTLDPMKLQVTLTSPQQFVQIMQGSGVFRVLAAYRFNVRDVEVSP